MDEGFPASGFHFQTLVRPFRVVLVDVAMAAGGKLLGLRSGTDSSASSERCAIQGGHSIRELENTSHSPASQQTIDEGSVKDVTRAGGVDRLHYESWRVNEPALPEHQSAFPAEGHAWCPDSVLPDHQLQDAKWVSLAGGGRQEVGRGNQVVDQGEESFDLFVDSVKVCHYRNAR